MKTIKDEALRAISSLPEDTPIDDIMYRLYVIDKIRNGQDAIREGRKISTEELKRELGTW